MELDFWFSSRSQIPVSEAEDSQGGEYVLDSSFHPVLKFRSVKLFDQLNVQTLEEVFIPFSNSGQ